MKDTIKHHTVIAFDFGKSTDKSSANYALAEYVYRNYKQNAVIYAQTLIYEILKGFGDDKMMKNVYEVASLGSNLTGKPNREGRIGDSYEVLEDVSEVLLKGSAILIVAQKYHSPRVRRQAQKLGFVAIVKRGLPSVWSKHDEQPWVRSFFVWWLRELFIARPKLKKYGRL